MKKTNADVRTVFLNFVEDHINDYERSRPPNTSTEQTRNMT